MDNPIVLPIGEMNILLDGPGDYSGAEVWSIDEVDDGRSLYADIPVRGSDEEQE